MDDTAKRYILLLLFLFSVSIGYGQDSVNGITRGYASGDLTYFANVWKKSYNAGEFDVEGTYFIRRGETQQNIIQPTGNGIAVEDFDLTEVAYLMYSEQNVFERFSNKPPYGNSTVGYQATYIVAVRYNVDTWEYSDNNVWIPFTPVATDVLIAQISTKNDTTISLQDPQNVDPLETRVVELENRLNELSDSIKSALALLENLVP